jgi:predicted nucleic acid-binding protein
VCDTGPLLAAAYRTDVHHRVAAGLIHRLGRNLTVLDTVLVEADTLLRRRGAATSARRLLAAVDSGAHAAAFLSPGLLSRAAELDARYADLGLGLVDASVMAYAERHDLPILTFDFRDFRATESRRGPWRLVLSERQLGV